MPAKRVRLPVKPEQRVPVPRVRLPVVPQPRVRLPEPEPKKRHKAKSNRALLSEDLVASLPAKAHAYMVWDAGARGSNSSIRGLHLHVQARTATKTFRYGFRFPGAKQAISYKLGRWPGMSLAQARELAMTAAKAVDQGHDPRTADVDPKRTVTFGELVEDWHKKEQVGRRRNESAEGTFKLVKLHTLAWTNRPAGTVRYAEVDDLLCTLRDDQGKRATAARLHSHLAALFRWAVPRRLPTNPMLGMKPPCTAPSRKEKVEGGTELQWLKAPKSDTVVQGLWALAGELGGDKEKFIKLLILTGKRRGIVQDMRWQAIDPHTWLWTPPKGTKTKRNNPMTLPALARRVLGAHKGEGTVLSFSDDAAGKLQAVVRKRLGIDDFIFHGVRHIVTSGLARLRVPPHASRLAMDHAPMKDVHSDYEQDIDWTPDVAAAMERWAGHVEGLVVPKDETGQAAANVTVLR